MPLPDALAAVGQHAFVRIEIVQRAAAAKYHAGLRIVRHAAGDVQLVVDRLGQTRQGSCAAGEDDAILEHVAGQLGRGALDDALDGLDQVGHRILQRLVNLGGSNGHRLGKTGKR